MKKTNVFELLKNVQEFKEGDWVVSKNTLFRIEGLPEFSYITRYTDEDWDQVFVNTFEEIKRKEWDFEGYWVCKLDEDNKLSRNRHYLFGVKYELFDPNEHSSLIKTKQKMDLLYSLELLNKDEDEDEDE